MSEVAVIMCTWKRPERLKNTLELVLAQTNKNFAFYIWNNNSEINNVVDLIYEEYKDKLEFSIIHSEKNVGGFGRYYLARTLIDKYEKFIFIDDDQTFSKEMINIFLNHYDNNAVKSRWSWKFNSCSYYDRHKIDNSGIFTHYCGTGGMIVPSKLFKCEKLYEIPEEFLFVEDLWLCFIANHYLSMKLISIADDGFIRQETDGKDQSTISFLTVKNKLLNYLIKVKGWRILEK